MEFLGTMMRVDVSRFDLLRAFFECIANVPAAVFPKE